ncbi:MAG: heme biosynthesis HemY N-terminal domain-containing protein [Aquisalimonadaceae bacterium]
MIVLFVLLGVLLLSAVGALWFHEQAGYVLVSIGNLSIETSLFLALGVSIVAVLLGYFLVRLLIRLIRTPGNLRGWWRRRRSSRARERLVRGLVKLAEGQYLDAERALINSVPHADTPLLHYLIAAWAAHRAGAARRRDHYLALADKADPKARMAIGLVQAQLNIEDKQWETAFATLTVLHEKWPKQPRVLELLARSCVPLGEWDRLLALLPGLRRQGVLTAEELAELECRAAKGSLLAASRRGEQALNDAWARLPRSATSEPGVILTYVDARMQVAPGDPVAEKLLRTGLRQAWQPGWIDRYGRLEMKDPAAPFAVVEAWLKDRPQDAALLLAAGRLAIANALWGRARAYLEAAVAREPTGEACYLLACLQERLGEMDEAVSCFRRAAELGGSFRRPANLQNLRQPDTSQESG